MAQGYSNVLRQQTARSLSGTVVGGIDRVPIADVRVEECSAAFVDCVDIAHSDSRGRFNVKSKRADSLHYLQFVAPGFDPDQVTVRLRVFAKKLRVELVTAT
jgi:hypothetical protein